MDIHVLLTCVSKAMLATARHGGNGGGFPFDVAIFIVFLVSVSELIRWIGISTG